MLGNGNENVGNVGVAKVLALRKQVAEESGNNNECPHALNSSSIRLFDVSTLNELGSKCLLQISQSLFLRATTSSNCKPYKQRSRRVYEETSGITPPMS